MIERFLFPANLKPLYRRAVAFPERRIFMVDVANGVIEIIAGKARTKTGPIELSDKLESLGLESLDVLELAFSLEEKFNIEIPFNANSQFEFTTVGDLVKAVERLVVQKTTPA
jgi:acyl carrier protein